MFTTFSTSVAFFGLAVIQFYGVEYLKIVLKFDAASLFIVYACLCVLGPIGGIIFGGVVTGKMGGYVKRKAIFLCLFLTILGAISATCMNLVDNKIYFVSLCLIYLFTVGAIIPPEAGITIASLENELRGDGYSLCNLLLNLIGNFPAPYAFSLILEWVRKAGEEDEKKKYEKTWLISMLYNFVGVLAISVSTYKRLKIEGDLVGEEKNNEEQEEIKDN